MSKYVIECTMRHDCPSLNLEKGDVVNIQGMASLNSVVYAPSPNGDSISTVFIVTHTGRAIRITRTFVILPGDSDYKS